MRGVLAVIVGYVTMAAWVSVVMTVAFALLGVDFVFVGGTTQVSQNWVILALALSLIGALIGGVVAAWVGRSPRNRPVFALAAMVLALGLLVAAGHWNASRAGDAGATPQPLPESVSFREAAASGVAPMWYHLAVPLIGYAGVMLGGRLKRPALPTTGA